MDLLINSNGRVTRGQGRRSPPTASSYPAGSYIIDLHQPHRGLVNTLLEPGLDITDRVDDLYAGPAAWSQGLTWGATVDTLETELPGRRDRARALRRDHLVGPDREHGPRARSA